MNKILQRAMIRHCNEYFTMTPEEQDAFRLADHDDLDKKISDFIYKEMDYSEDDKDAAKQLEYNKIVLGYNGIGRPPFLLNEFDWNTKILNHKTLYDYNTWYHNWQEEACEDDENYTDYKPSELYNRFAAWARAEINDEFFYINLVSLQMWLYWRLEEFSFDWIDKEIPNKFVPGPDNGKKVKGGYTWDMRTDAKGLEGWYEQINDFSHEYLNKKYDEVLELNNVVYIIDTTEDDFDPAKDYILGSLDVLKEITFIDFVKDCDKVVGNNDDIHKLEKEELEKFKTALENKLVEVKKTPPNMMKLKKKKGIVMTEDALDDLEDIE